MHNALARDAQHVVFLFFTQEFLAGIVERTQVITVPPIIEKNQVLGRFVVVAQFLGV